MLDIILRCVEDLGFLPIIRYNDTEIYRGEYQKTSEEALEQCHEVVAKMNKESEQ